jgi:prepilin-type N-terminal cleavage/methylation domain-containing protein/prepilin-type processing-associated H-X9-DG protein
MLWRRRRGFTLIELLVVIAIIAILAAMLFPVFARARESARKIQCLSNVKNIATAVQMYLTDYDRFPPGPYGDPGAVEYFQTGPGRGSPNSGCWRISWANPHIRWQVVLEEYVRNREVWRCPSARWSASIWAVIPDYGSNGTWWGYWKDHEGEWGTGKTVSPCTWAIPPGWGGDVTDSLAQQRMAATQEYGWIDGVHPGSGPDCFEATIGCTDVMDTDVKVSSIQDASNHIVCGDNGTFTNLHTISRNLFGLCVLCGGADWENCPVTRNCGLDGDVYDLFWSDPGYRAKYTRHMGGSNLGFADGHASWFLAERIRTLHGHTECCTPETNYTGSTWYDGPMTGMCPCW